MEAATKLRWQESLFSLRALRRHAVWILAAAATGAVAALFPFGTPDTLSLSNRTTGQSSIRLDAILVVCFLPCLGLFYLSFLVSFSLAVNYGEGRAQLALPSFLGFVCFSSEN